MELVQQYVRALQAVIGAGASVFMLVDGQWISVVMIRVGDCCLELGYIVEASPRERYVSVPLSTELMITFEDWPLELVQAGWFRQ